MHMYVHQCLSTATKTGISLYVHWQNAHICIVSTSPCKYRRTKFLTRWGGKVLLRKKNFLAQCLPIQKLFKNKRQSNALLQRRGGKVMAAKGNWNICSWSLHCKITQIFTCCPQTWQKLHKWHWFEAGCKEKQTCLWNAPVCVVKLAKKEACWNVHPWIYTTCKRALLYAPEHFKALPGKRRIWNDTLEVSHFGGFPHCIYNGIRHLFDLRLRRNKMVKYQRKKPVTI